jgi:hypothetical protein
LPLASRTFIPYAVSNKAQGQPIALFQLTLRGQRRYSDELIKSSAFHRIRGQATSPHEWRDTRDTQISRAAMRNARDTCNTKISTPASRNTRNARDTQIRKAA